MNIRSFGLMALLALLTASAALTQQWMGPAKITGVVLDENEEPIEGARVSVVLLESPDVFPPAVTTSRRGKFTVPRLAPGEWGIRIQADGYVVSEGIALVFLNRDKPLRVILRPLKEVSPSFAETPASIKGWLEKGNSFLEQGYPNFARVEYEKALSVVPPPAQPEILRAVARTHVEEKNYERALKVLKRALVYGPDDAASREFFLLLMDALKRKDEADEWLQRLDDQGAEAMKAEMKLPDPPARSTGGIPLRLNDGIVADAPQANRRGSYRVAFSERHPLGDLSVIESRYGYDHEGVLETDPDAGTYKLSEESFQVYAPEVDGAKGAAAQPMGLLVWISPTPRGQPRQPEHLDILAKHGIIWVGANDAGNPRPGWDRIGLALDAVHNMKKLYDIDEERVYVAGYSGGGRIASGMSIHFPEVFHGAFFMHGCDYYRHIEAPDKPGMFWPATFQPPSKEIFKLVKQRNRYVFLTGEMDFNRLQTKTFERLYREDGFKHTTYFEMPGQHHYSGVSAEWFDKILTYLEK